LLGEGCAYICDTPQPRIRELQIIHTEVVSQPVPPLARNREQAQYQGYCYTQGLRRDHSSSIYIAVQNSNLILTGWVPTGADLFGVTSQAALSRMYCFRIRLAVHPVARFLKHSAPINSPVRRFSMGSISPDWDVISTRGDVPPYRLFTKPIETSEQEDRDYRVIELQNGLQAVIISDPNADKAAASLDVAVGHLFDPVSHC
jgi:hypothetical protein